MIKIFSTPACSYCVTLKEFLKERHIEFEEVDVSKDEEAQRYIAEKTGRLEVPVIEIDNEIVIGFDRPKICRLLNIKD